MATEGGADPGAIVEAFDQLKRSGWSVGVAGLATEGGGIVWVVSGTNSENVIRAEGRTEAAAWRTAVDQARAVGMLAGWRVSEAGVGVGDGQRDGHEGVDPTVVSSAAI
jgi:hypothetical protein